MLLFTASVQAAKVGNPSFSPAAGTYTSIQTVTISTATSGASIRYTLDGSTPSATAGTLYSAPVSIASTTTLKAIGFMTGSTNSNVTSGTYTINLPVVAAPSFSPVAGTYTSVQTVTIATTTIGASIRYTTDGSTPSATVGTLYSSPISIGATTTLKAIGFKTGSTNSSVTSGAYTINLPVTAPTFTPAPGTYTSAQTVAIASTTNGASIRYTVDGSTPSETMGTLYSSPVNVAATTTVKAVAYKNGLPNSSVTSGTYTINLTAATPVFSPLGGNFENAQAVTITTPTSGASIRYTTDGSTPTQINGFLYSGAVSIQSTATLKAIAYRIGYGDSAVASDTYSLRTAPPDFNHAPGVYDNALTISLSSATSAALFRYTTDGSDPTTTIGTLYSSPIAINSATVLKAIAYRDGFADSSVSNGTYTLQTATPTFRPANVAAHTVGIESTTSGAVIRYTTDGSTPTETTGTLYSGPITIDSPTLLAAVAYRNGFTMSTVARVSITVPTITITNPANGATINSP